MSEREQRLAKALRTQAKAIALLIEASESLDRAYDDAALLFRSATKDVAALSHEVDEAAITQVALTSQAFLEQIDALREIAQQLMALLPPARELRAVLTEIAEQKEGDP